MGVSENGVYLNFFRHLKQGNDDSISGIRDEIAYFQTQIPASAGVILDSAPLKGKLLFGEWRHMTSHIQIHWGMQAPGIRYCGCLENPTWPLRLNLCSQAGVCSRIPRSPYFWRSPSSVPCWLSWALQDWSWPGGHAKFFAAESNSDGWINMVSRKLDLQSSWVASFNPLSDYCVPSWGRAMTNRRWPHHTYSGCAIFYRQAFPTVRNSFLIQQWQFDIPNSWRFGWPKEINHRTQWWIFQPCLICNCQLGFLDRSRSLHEFHQENEQNRATMWGWWLDPPLWEKYLLVNVSSLLLKPWPSGNDVSFPSYNMVIFQFVM